MILISSKNLLIMESSLRDQLTAHLREFKRLKADRQVSQNEGLTISTVPYGTAGFRANAAQIEHLFYNIGLVSALRSLQSRKSVGVMITASHNPIQDNGAKFIDSNGEMLDSQWEPIVEKFCNTREVDEIIDQLEVLVEQHKIDTSSENKGRVLIGMDTRPSSEALVDLVKQGVQAWSPIAEFVDYGLITTPALHYLVAESNRLTSVLLSPQIYYDKLVNGLVSMFGDSKTTHQSYSPEQLVIDCANGVGIETLNYLCKNNEFSKRLPLRLINTGDGILNKMCGADYVKTKHLPPMGADEVNFRYASLDGDADRVVYFYLEKSTPQVLELNLLDGDKIMALYALYLKEAIKKSGLESKLTIGVVQTAYANGAATDYITRVLGLKVDCVDTGVKNLHKQALNYDVGIYFEANGHGTIWVSQNAKEMIMEGANGTKDLQNLLAILNNYTGDAISDILVVETILRYFDWDIKQWHKLYSDRPNSLIKIEVPNRDLIKTKDAGRICTEPTNLQPLIDSTVSKYGSDSRAFVRPSGTEDVVRIYAESSDQGSAEELANDIAELIKKELFPVTQD